MADRSDGTGRALFGPLTKGGERNFLDTLRAENVGALLLLVGPPGCSPKPTLAELDHKVFATPLTSFDRWWRGEQAAANGVTRSTIDRWLATAPRRLDSAAARRRPWDVSTTSPSRHATMPRSPASRFDASGSSTRSTGPPSRNSSRGKHR